MNDQLEAIGHHIQLIKKEEAKAEKENKKKWFPDISPVKDTGAALDTCFSVLMQNDLSLLQNRRSFIITLSECSLDGLETLLQSLCKYPRWKLD